MRSSFRVSSCFLWLFVSLVAALAPPARADSLDAPFVAALRERRLFELAERYCVDRINSSQTAEVERADLAVELIRTLATHAGHVPRSDRDTFWQAAHSAAADFQHRRPNHPRLVLIKIQDALTPLAQGELAWQEHEAGLLPAAELETARQMLGKGAESLTAQDKELAREIPLRRRTALKTDELSAEELLALQQHVQYHMARARRLRGLLYAAGSDDRLAQLVAARQILEPLRTQVAADDVLAALVRLELAECLRLTERFEEATESLSGRDADGVEPGIQLQARAVALRLAMDQHNSLEIRRILEEGDLLGGQASAELDLARLQAWLVLGDYDQAAATARKIEDRHGPYWTRRVGQALVTALPSDTDIKSAELLARRADQLVVTGKPDEALADYDRAAALARQAMDENAAFELAYKAALIEQQRKRNGQSARRLRSLATASPKHSQAAAAHLLAAWNAKATNEYEAILREHLATWPTADTATQAGLWLAQLAESRGQWQEALDAYATIPGSSPHFAAANSRLAHLAKDQPESGPVQEAYAASLLESGDVKTLQSALTQWQLVARRSKPNQPRWLKANYSLALTHFKLGDIAAAAKVLQAVIDQPPGLRDAEWKEKYELLLKQCGK
jgi:hypothetical protein